MTDIEASEVIITTKQTIYLVARVELELEGGAPVPRKELVDMLREQVAIDLGPGEAFFAEPHGVYRMVRADVQEIDSGRAKWLADTQKGVRYGTGRA